VFGVLAKDTNNKEDADVQSVITQITALTTQSQLMAAMTAATSSLVASAIQQLNANQ
jgi:hypothetical protein